MLIWQDCNAADMSRRLAEMEVAFVFWNFEAALARTKVVILIWASFHTDTEN